MQVMYADRFAEVMINVGCARLAVGCFLRRLLLYLRKEKRIIIRQLLQEYDIESAQDIQDALKDLLGGTSKEMMEAEMDEHLGYSKSECSDNDDYRMRSKGEASGTRTTRTRRRRAKTVQWSVFRTRESPPPGTRAKSLAGVGKLCRGSCLLPENRYNRVWYTGIRRFLPKAQRIGNDGPRPFRGRGPGL